VRDDSAGDAATLAPESELRPRDSLWFSLFFSAFAPRAPAPGLIFLYSLLQPIR
jgi:hypothetical protein